MEIEIIRAAEMTLAEFADKHGLKMRVEESGIEKDDRFRAILHTEKNGPIAGLSATDFLAGRGETPEEAIEDHRKRISGRNIAIGSQAFLWGCYPITIKVPRLLPAKTE